MSNFSKLFSLINQGILHKKLKVKVKKNKVFISLLQILYLNGYIRFFTLSSKDNYIYIYLKYKYNISVIKEILVFSKPSQRFFISYRELYKLYREKNLFGIVSTDLGFLTISSCLLLKKGGEFICLID